MSKVRNARLSPEQRKEIPTKVSKAEAVARSRKAKARPGRRGGTLACVITCGGPASEGNTSSSAIEILSGQIGVKPQSTVRFDGRNCANVERGRNECLAKRT